MSQLNEESITFGKYNGKTLTDVLKDRSYCKWLKDQEWFRKEYEYLYNRVCKYTPRDYFIPTTIQNEYTDIQNFLDNYPYFNLTQPQNLQITLTETELKCYYFYNSILQDFKSRIFIQIESDNPYDIKAPIKWLQRFEKETGLDRTVFKSFIYMYDLKNITGVLEDIKKRGGIEYKGAQSFKIAKKRSEKQEKVWENRLKKKYGEDLSVQFKYKNCFFDFLCIPNKVIYECKLGLKDFNQEQYEKYLLTLGEYSIIYLIGKDVIIDIANKVIVVKRGLPEFERDLYTLKGPFIDLISEYEIKTLKQGNKLMEYI